MAMPPSSPSAVSASPSVCSAAAWFGWAGVTVTVTVSVQRDHLLSFRVRVQRRRLLHERRLESLGAFAADEVGAEVEDLQGGVGLARRRLRREGLGQAGDARRLDA